MKCFWFLFVCVKFEVAKKKKKPKNLDILVILVTLLPTLEVWIAFFYHTKTKGREKKMKGVLKGRRLGKKGKNLERKDCLAPLTFLL